MSNEWYDQSALFRDRDRHSKQDFQREIMGQWPNPKFRCEMHTKIERCPNEAKFKVSSGEAVSEAHVCDQCIVPWMMSIQPGIVILVFRL